MDSRTQERVERWDSRPFNGGYDGLSDLADSGFSGAVTAVGTWLFMLNGRVVGVVDGDIEDFENASGTRYEAPDPSLPLLCSMEERGGETRAKYYTNETPLREVDETLQNGSFTGYLVLSENVLSGDYYVVYYGGRRMAAAYIGNAERLLTGDDAFDRAADEVGIYEVLDVDVDVTDVPGTEPDSATGSGDAADAGGTTAESTPAGNESARSVAGSDSSAEATSSDESTASALESIDFSGGSADEDADDGSDDSLGTSEIDLTDDPAGITTTADVDPEPASAGITDTEIDLGPVANGPDAESATSESTESDLTSGISSDLPIEDAESVETSDAAADVDGSGTDSAASQDEGISVDFSAADAESTGSADASVSEPSDDDDGATESAMSPDLAEIEAAAEELDRNDISWVDDDEPEATAETETASADDGSDPAASTSSSRASDLDERFEEEEQWRETRSIPSIDPDHSKASSPRLKRSSQSRSSANADRSASRSSPSSGSQAERSPTETQESTGSRQERRAGSRSPSQSRSGTDRSSDGAAANERIEKLSDRLETLEEQRDVLRTRAEELETERDELRSKNQQLASTVERLQSRIDELETELERAREEAAEATAATDADDGFAATTELPPQQALSQTNLFVRYASKSRPTLEKAHDGAADRNEVATNLRLEHHTQFDAADAAVDGRPFEEFLTSTMAYRFVDWLTEMVLYEIRDTGNADGLADLYDAIPRIDRAEFGAAISLEDDDTDDVPDRVEFDIVAYDKMGNPLVCANLNDSRTPATQGMLKELEESASAVKANYPDLAAAIVVTSSYFEPGALEIAEQATSGGLLSRGSKLSYVNLSRKAGYHLCLVESRSEGFHMNVPEL